MELPLTDTVHETSIHEVFVEGLPCAMHCSKSWDTTESKREKVLFPRSLDSSGRETQFIYIYLKKKTDSTKNSEESKARQGD